MIIDLLHNKIVKDTITDAFAESVNDVLIPLLEDRYGDSIERVTMYEDYIADELLYEGEWYYPLSVKLVGSETFVCWVKWQVNKKSFKNSIPYSFVGEGQVDFALADFLPSGFEDKLAGRAIDYNRNAIALKIEAIADDPLFLSGRYSQTFVDELASQITAELSRILGVSGIEKSTMELQLVFAPGTYLEHTSENVTYRRLLLVDKGCQPRDFWVKWTRLDGAIGYTVNDNVNKDTVKFELGEDVSQKIREKEYRFLSGANPDKYQSAMGKKTVTEWRDITKRAIKRGDITRVVSDIEIAQHADDVSSRLRALLDDMGVSTTATSEPAPEQTYDDVAALAMAALGNSVETEEIEAEDDGYVFGDIDDEPPFEVELTVEEPDEEPISVFDEIDEAIDAEEDEEENVFEFSFSDGESETGVTFEEYTEATDSAVETAAPTAPVIDEEAIRREIEAKLRLEYETEARLRAEKEAERLRIEHERLLEENERLARIAREREEERLAQEEAKRREEEARRLAEEERQRELEAKKAEEARIRAEIEEQMRLEAKERERVAEAARMAVEEQKRLEAERAEKELREREAALEREAERLRREEEARRIAEQKRLEAEKRREEEERRRREEEEARRRVQIVTKQAKLMFRYSVDLNVIKRIKEVVEETLVANNKQKLNIHIKAYPQDTTSIVLEIKLPQNEMDLLVSMMKALGGASLGITKIILE